MKFSELKRGAIISPPKSWGWGGGGPYIVDSVTAEHAHVVLWDTPSGVGTLRKASWRSHMLVGQLSPGDLEQFTEFVNENYKG